MQPTLDYLVRFSSTGSQIIFVLLYLLVGN